MEPLLFKISVKKLSKMECLHWLISDHGNMFGAFEFVAEAYKHKDEQGKLKIKPVVGCEFYVPLTAIRKLSQKINGISGITRYCWQKMKKVTRIL
jgi:DNA polymerase III alpha subunit